jgi:hypothetical protein
MTTTYQVRVHYNTTTNVFFDSVKKKHRHFGADSAIVRARADEYKADISADAGFSQVYAISDNTVEYDEFEITAETSSEVRVIVREMYQAKGFVCVHKWSDNRVSNPSNTVRKVIKTLRTTATATSVVSIEDAVKAARSVVSDISLTKAKFIRDCLESQLKFFRNTQDAADFALELAA